jgi:tRNA threonylcarbamoyladenosine biosynthesis protein TsaB
MKDIKVLGITSAIGIIGAGICGEDNVLSECSVSGKIVQTEKLISLVDELLKRTKLKIGDIDAVAVTTGPGSYSGLRGGLATAKAFAQALDIPIISVSTLHAIAYNFIDIEGTVAVAVNACRDDYNFSIWGASRGKLKRLTADLTVKIDKIVDVMSSVKGKMTLAADEALKERIKGDNILLADPRSVLPWAVNVARIGLEKLKDNEVEDYITLSPSYSHKPNIREYKK